jgi:hypothetical protein
MAAKMYRVYSVIERPKQEDFWLNIGMAFPHDEATVSTWFCKHRRCTATGSS